MPRKTRKQKKQADSRRMQIAYVPPSVIENGTRATPVASPAKKKKLVYVTEYEESNYDKVLRNFTKKDMRKTILVIVALFLLQLAVFYLYTSGRI